MKLAATQGGLFVAVSVFGVILYQARTVLEFVGISIPILPYMGVISLLMIAVYGWFVLTGRVDTTPPPAPVSTDR